MDELSWDQKMYTDQKTSHSEYKDVKEVESSVLFGGLIVK